MEREDSSTRMMNTENEKSKLTPQRHGGTGSSDGADSRSHRIQRDLKEKNQVKFNLLGDHTGNLSCVTIWLSNVGF